MKRAVEIRTMMKSNLQKELDVVEDLIIKKALTGRTSITLERLSSEVREELKRKMFVIF